VVIEIGPGDKLLTLKEVAQILRLSYHRTWEIVAVEGKIPALRVGHMYLVPEKALYEYLNRKLQEGGYGDK